MNVLLVNPYIYDFTAFDLWMRPLGLLYVAGVLKKYTDCELFWLDALDRFQEGATSANDRDSKAAKADGRGKFHREIVTKPLIYEKTNRQYARYGIPLDVFRRKLEQFPAVDLILITTLMTYWLDGFEFTIDILRERFPGAKIVLGGILSTLVPEEIIKSYLDVDYLVSGTGEDKILDLVQSLGARVFPHPDLSDIDNHPYPAVEFFSNREILPLLTSRGCPYRCSYCASRLLAGNFVERANEKILEEIFYMHDTYGTRHYAIFDDAFLVNKHRRFLKIFQQVRDKLKVNFHTPNGLHAREIDRETAELFYSCGFRTLRLSFESITAEILEKSSHKVSVGQMIEAVENLETAGYERRDIDVYLLFGVPGQKMEDLDAALNFAEDLGVSPHLSYFSPVPGTRDFVELQKAGILSTPQNIYETNKIYFVYSKSGFSGGEIKEIKNRASRIISAIKNK
jgi:radical SAM superfamily enzyme YgiQ (UPF0313 family)